MNQSDINSTSHESSQVPPHHNWLYRRVALPIFALLRMGASPQKLAWSIAVGLLIGINPILGSTTVFCLAAAFLLRLNIPASQLANHLVYPFELLLVIPFIHVGTILFHIAPIPFSARGLLHAARAHPLALTRQLWVWEWHAFLLWLALAAIAVPVIALAITPWLKSLLIRIERHQYPIIQHTHHHLHAERADP
ncbi:MAG TPA: DUF2062 domain-containing protein [Edaphobacter sp.]|nr:DUF2062 domain-containing protein [Edaphobacter sp.]